MVIYLHSYPLIMISKAKATEIWNDVAEYCVPFADVSSELYYSRLKEYIGRYVIYTMNSGSSEVALKNIERQIKAELQS